MLARIITLAVSTLVSGTCLYAGMKLTKVDGEFLGMLVVAFFAGIAGMVPGVGWILAPVVMFVLISKLTDAEFWPDAVLMVVVARAFAVGALIFLGALLQKT